MDKQQAVEFLADFIKRYNTQDNAGTAFPIYVALQQTTDIVVDGDYGYDRIAYYHSDFFETSFESKEEFVNFLKENGYADDSNHENPSIREYLDGLNKLYIKEVWEDREVFLTMDGYNEHMRLNSHNYRRGKVRPYIKHAFRSPELLSLLKAIAAVAGVELEKK